MQCLFVLMEEDLLTLYIRQDAKGVAYYALFKQCIGVYQWHQRRVLIIYKARVALLSTIPLFIRSETYFEPD
jgi:hypothetical protein